jgi:hypothetical protein
MTSDIFFNYGILISSKIINNRNRSPLYKYLFTYEAPFGPIKNLFNVKKGKNIYFLISFFTFRIL